MAQLVLDDPSLRDMLYRFVKDYAEAQHAIEITNVAGSGAFELIRKRQRISTFFPATNRRTLIPSSPTRGIHHELNRAHTLLATVH